MFVFVFVQVQMFGRCLCRRVPAECSESPQLYAARPAEMSRNGVNAHKSAESRQKLCFSCFLQKRAAKTGDDII